jgi:hypothetical protein
VDLHARSCAVAVAADRALQALVELHAIQQPPVELRWRDVGDHGLARLVALPADRDADGAPALDEDAIDLGAGVKRPSVLLDDCHERTHQSGRAALDDRHPDLLQRGRHAERAQGAAGVGRRQPGVENPRAPQLSDGRRLEAAEPPGGAAACASEQLGPAWPARPGADRQQRS